MIVRTLAWTLAVLLGAAVVMAVVVLAGRPALAQQRAPPMSQCYPANVAFQKSFEQFGEVPEFVFVNREEAIFAMTVNRESGAWSIWKQNAADLMCFVAGGDIFGNASPALRGLVVPEEDT